MKMSYELIMAILCFSGVGVCMYVLYRLMKDDGRDDRFIQIDTLEMGSSGVKW